MLLRQIKHAFFFLFCIHNIWGLQAVVFVCFLVFPMQRQYWPVHFWNFLVSFFFFLIYDRVHACVREERTPFKGSDHSEISSFLALQLFRSWALAYVPNVFSLTTSVVTMWDLASFEQYCTVELASHLNFL